MYHPWRSIAVTVHFGAFLRSTEDLEFEFYFVMPEAFNSRRYSIPIPNNLIRVSAYFDQKTHVYTAHLWLQIPKKLTVEEEDPSQPIVAMNRSFLKQNMHLDLDQGEIAVLCKLNNVQEQGLPLTNNNEQGYLYSQIPILYRDKATGIVITRSGFTQVLSKEQFLKYYRPKTILE
ncbi:hypothetical protein Celal_1676 [Cellulophaga algicola DSM 14237]|uniref:Uncharacterized protein n=1 Tax=Cellulophaga algicola (strain DSM 14237 / IC166 / ACAM 630) TaxID=688270 RepID=E6XBY1_CELAD|nr:hypothetical protein [Cellulophaga algicola]ADV48983.1 hypothetical protein Celal_1676 [Cellulophaga algicola DSM 14237]